MTSSEKILSKGLTHRRRLGHHTAANLVPELTHPRRPTPRVLALSRHPAGRCRRHLKKNWAGPRGSSLVERSVQQCSLSGLVLNTSPVAAFDWLSVVEKRKRKQKKTKKKKKSRPLDPSLNAPLATSLSGSTNPGKPCRNRKRFHLEGKKT